MTPGETRITAPAAPVLTQHQIKVLLIDDQQIVAKAVERMLEAEKDILFYYCQDPSQAMKVAQEVMPTIILQDLVMPEIDGMTLVKFFRRHPKLKDVPMIVLSSQEEATTKAEAFAYGANDYLVKLPDRIELIARIRYHSAGYITLLQRNEAYEALLASQKALAAELSSAADYVVSLLPHEIPAGPIRTHWRFVPSMELGGDCFGYHWIDSEHFAMYLLDVCGHGVGSALLSVSAFNVIRSHTLPNIDFRAPEEVLSALNDAFLMENHNGLYFTIWYGVFNTATRILNYASGGHPPALLLTKPDRAASLITENFFIGGLDSSVYTSATIEVPENSRLYIFSDGVYEVDRPDGTMWTLEELEDFLKSYAGDEQQEIDALYQYVRELHSNKILDDDFSMMRISLL
ncbi:MAG: fused response regulator/phosphatase [Syntrophales bacterium]|nr:fused response regulator/phosphatase [Syntrophales bacterium]